MRKTVLAILVVFGLCAAGPKWSQADDSTGAENKAVAQQHYNAGLRAYNVGEFDQAIKEWKAAYQFLGAPDFLFNIAQAYRQKREYGEAVFFYNAYLRGKPDAPNVGEVTALRDEMSLLLETQKKNEQMAPEPKELLGPNGERKEVQPAAGTSTSNTRTADAPVETSQTPTSTESNMVVVDGGASSSSGNNLRTAGMIAGGTGVLFVATGIAFALSASSTESDLEAAAANQEVWSRDFMDMEDSADRSATVGTVLIITGIAAIVGGGASYYLGRKKNKEARALARGVQVKPTLALESTGPAVGLNLGWSY